MKKQILTLMVGTFLVAATPAFSMDIPEENADEAPPYLRWQDRGPEIQAETNECFAAVKERKEVAGRFTGEEYYMLAGIYERYFIASRINANLTKKVWTFGDVGCGYGQWGDQVAKDINERCSHLLPYDVKINIIGMGGENFEGEEHYTIGRCDIYKLYGFKVEDLATELPKRLNKWGVSPKFSQLHTRLCLLHLRDPGAVVAQMYDVLEEGGLGFSDGFQCVFKGQRPEKLDIQAYRENMLRFLWNMRVPFLIDPNADMHYFQYIFKKKDDNPLKLPLQYDGLCTLEYGQRRVVYELLPSADFKLTEQNLPSIPTGKTRGRWEDLTLYGNSQSLFDEVTANHLYRKKYVHLGHKK